MVIQLRDVTRTFAMSDRKITALTHVDLDVDAGKLVCICGPSGSGKTTLLLTIGGMLQPDEGKVAVVGRELYALSRRERAHFRATQLGFVFQMFHLVPYLTVRENILLPLGSLQDLQNTCEADCDQLIERLGLAHRADHKPAQLSTGERQRTAIARATLLKPPLLLADEPTGNLDEESAAEVYRVLTEYRDQGGTVFIVTHMPAAVTHADRVLRMVDGRLQNESSAVSTNENEDLRGGIQ